MSGIWNEVFEFYSKKFWHKKLFQTEIDILEMMEHFLFFEASLVDYGHLFFLIVFYLRAGKYRCDSQN